jgi:hypothetical protein
MMPVSKSARSLLVTDHTYILPMHTSERGARSIRDRARRQPKQMTREHRRSTQILTPPLQGSIR